MTYPLPANRAGCANALRQAIAARSGFFDSLGPVRGREGRIAGIQAVALSLIAAVIEDPEPRNRIADISSILDATALVIAEQGPPARETA
jgi:hypothetical protein